MRSYQLLTLFILVCGLVFTACQSDKGTSAAAERAGTIVPNATANPFQNAPGSPAAAAAAPAASNFGAAQAHYVCPNGCAGGNGPAQGNCPVCGTAMNHNAAYHNAAATTTTPNTADPEANAPISAFNTAEPHYKCPNACAGGGGPAKGNCPVCGTAMEHNTAYHNAAANSTPTPSLTVPDGINLNTSTSTTSAAQNAAGVFHYTCSNGCAGGAASAVACSTCGATLVHNTAYHGN